MRIRTPPFVTLAAALLLPLTTGVWLGQQDSNSDERIKRLFQRHQNCQGSEVCRRGRQSGHRLPN